MDVQYKDSIIHYTFSSEISEWAIIEVVVYVCGQEHGIL